MRLDVVAALLRDVAERELVPRFRRLSELRVESKATAEDPTDIVTEADEAVEIELEPDLLLLQPGSIAVGEEATARTPAIRDALADAEWAWLIDPLDGTKNFAAGRPTWGTMVALCRRGEAVAAWIHLPLAGETYVAERGSGAFVEGRRLLAPEPDASRRPRGTPYVHFMAPELRADVERRAAEHAEVVPGLFSAAMEYTRLARGERDFAVYWRLLPWDHAPGSLLLEEAGGRMRHPDGSPYRPGERRTFALACSHASEWDRLRRDLLP